MTKPTRSQERSDKNTMREMALEWFAQDQTHDFEKCFLAGVQAGLDRAAETVTEELGDLEAAEFGERDKERINIRAWLMNARARIRAEKERV